MDIEDVKDDIYTALIITLTSGVASRVVSKIEKLIELKIAELITASVKGVDED